MGARQSEAEKVRRILAEALFGVERYALPLLEAVKEKASLAYRFAERAAKEEEGYVWTKPGAEELRAALDLFDRAAAAAGLSDAMWSPRWILSSAISAASFLVEGQTEDARKLAVAVRGWARGEEAKAKEQERERSLLAYQEAFWALRRGEQPTRYAVEREGQEDLVAELLAAGRMCGGVVIEHDHPVLATDWLAAAQRSPAPEVRELARLVEQGRRKAAKA